MSVVIELRETEGADPSEDLSALIDWVRTDEDLRRARVEAIQPVVEPDAMGGIADAVVSVGEQSA